MKALGAIDYAVVAAFFAAMVGVGLYYGRREKSVSGFFGNDKSLPWWLLGVSFYMNSFSALAFVMYSALAYKHGWVPVTISWLSVPAVLLGIWVLALRWRRSAAGSPIAFVTERFGGKMNQALMWLGLPMQVLDSAFKLLAIGTVVGVMVKSVLPPTLPLDTVLGWSIAVSGIVIIFYTFLGGLKATLVCDFLQFLVICVVVAVLPVLCLTKLASLDGGAGAAHGFAVFLERIPKGFLDFTAGMYDWHYMFFYFLLMFLSLGTTWSLIQRYSSTRSEREAKKMGYLVAVLLLVGPPLFFFPAMAARVFLPDLDMANPDTMNGVYALTCLAVLPAGMLGLVIAAMFAATMSTLAGNYNAIANVLTDDFYVRALHPGATPGRRMVIARVATVLTGLTVIGCTFLMRCVQGASDLFDVTNQVLSVFAPPIGIAMIAGVLSRRLTRRAGFAGFLFGIGIGFAAFLLGGMFPVLRESVPMFWITSISTLLGLAMFSVFLKDDAAAREATDAFFRRIETPEGA